MARFRVIGVVRIERRRGEFLRQPAINVIIDAGDAFEADRLFTIDLIDLAQANDGYLVRVINKNIVRMP